MTQNITIDGPEVARDDGSRVCIGYYADEDGQVLDRFAVPAGTYTISEDVASVKYVDSMDALADVAKSE